jgi:hypothetical protein
MEVIKNTMKRKGMPGFTKAAIARSILMDTVFPGADKEVGGFNQLFRPLLKTSVFEKDVRPSKERCGQNPKLLQTSGILWNQRDPRIITTSPK